MTIWLLGFLLTVVGYAVLSTVGCVIVGVAWRVWHRRIDALSPHRRSDMLFSLRLFPATVGALVTFGIFGRAFVLLEPRDSTEVVGPGLAAVALAAMVLVLRGPIAGFRAWQRSNALSRGWLAAADPEPVANTPAETVLVDTAFPVVSVVGVLKPIIVVAREVRATCTEEELTAILAHEGAHIDRRDNLRHLLMKGAPDLLAWTHLGDDLEQAWAEASEEAADELADTPLTTDLASALVKVARLAVGASSHPATITSLYGSGTIARRVERLVSNGAPRAERHHFLSLLALAGAVVVVTFAPVDLLYRVQALTEALVALLQ